MKKFLGVFVMVLALSFSSNVFADGFQVHIVDSLGENSIFRDGGTFQLSETPYLYFNVPNLEQITFGGSFWLDPTNKLDVTTPSQISGNDVWLSLDWKNIAKTPGLWTVTGWYTHQGESEGGFSTFSFASAPEPVSTVLFLLGGATLAVRRAYKSKKS